MRREQQSGLFIPWTEVIVFVVAAYVFSLLLTWWPSRGTGRHALKLARRGTAVTALDQSRAMVAIGQAAARAHGSRVEFVLASLETGLPFAAGRFELVICALVLCHLAPLAQIVREFHRVLRPGGQLLITDFHPDSIAYGWRTSFWAGCSGYNLPNARHTRADYIEAVQSARFHTARALDIPVREAPAGYFREETLHEIGDMNLCLILSAQKF